MIDERPRSLAEILKLVQKYWGFSELRPLQEEAIRAGLDRRDSLVVMPTGGGKSLCYQVPAALTERTDIVVSPLIALMKDQADKLAELGVSSRAVNSTIPAADVETTLQEIRATTRQLRLFGSYPAEEPE